VPDWKAVGTGTVSAGGASYTSLTFTGSTVYVAYRDNANGSQLTVMKYNGTSWTQVGASLTGGGLATYPSLAIINSTLYVAFNDSSAGVMVFSFNGSSWVQVGTVISATTGSNVCLAAAGNTPYVAYMDDNASEAIAAASYNGASWVSLAATGLTAPSYSGGQPLRLAILSTTPYVAYSDSANSGKLSVMKYNGSSWSAVGTAGFSPGAVGSISPIVFSGATPYVAYQDQANTYKPTLMSFNGTSWAAVGAADFTSAFTNNVGLAMVGSTPYVSFTDGFSPNSNQANVWSYNGSSWAQKGTANFTNSINYNNNLCVGVDGSGVPYVAYEDSGNSEVLTVMSFH
jgi:hypothetical protein